MKKQESPGFSRGEQVNGPYASTAADYWRAGWRGILPLPSGAKWPPPKGYTGDAGGFPSYPDIHAWSEGREGSGNIGLRLPVGVVGLDVDSYGDKPGGETLALAESQHGPLPATWRTTSRDDGISGIRLYRVPESLRWPTEIGPGVEVIRHGHRYAVAPPSVHPEGGVYRWITPEGATSVAVPDPDLLPELPDAWVAAYTGGQLHEPTSKTDIGHDAAVGWIVAHQHATAVMCPRMERGLAQYTEAAAASTHDAVVKATLRIARLADEGHHGAVHAVADVRRRFLADVTDPERALLGEHRRDETEAVAEFGRAIASAVGVVLANPSETTTCDCFGQITGMITSTGSSTASTTDGSSALAPHEAADTAAVESGVDDVMLKRLRDGATFILDAPDDVPAIWGDGDECLWAEGEALMVVGPPGVGKSTLCGQVVRNLLGLGTGRLLGMTVQPRQGRVLYLAMDRPQQIARALRRQFDEGDRNVLADRLRVWEGPPPGDVAKHPDVLLSLAEIAEADCIVVDSVKDAAVGLTDDEVASSYNRARQKCLAHSVEVLELHHMVKRGNGGNKPTELADVYGSAWLTAGAGSVLLLWGAAGDPVVEMKHLKQPAAEVGPLQLIHDHEHGSTTVYHATDLLMLVAHQGTAGLTAKDAALALFEDTETRSVEKARRKLRKLETAGHVERQERGTASGGQPMTVWVTANACGKPVDKTTHGPLTHTHAPLSAEGTHEPLTHTHAETQKPRSDTHETTHAHSRDTHAPRPLTHTPSPNGEGVQVGGSERGIHDAEKTGSDIDGDQLHCNRCGKPIDRRIVETFRGYCGVCHRERRT